MLKLLTRQTCPSCRGAGRCPHPAWTRFWEDWRARHGTLSELQDDTTVVEWFQDQGYDRPPAEENP
jgi:hypothetical protein